MPILKTQCWTNDNFTLHCGTKTISHNIRWIKPYESDKNIEDINIENIYEVVNILLPVIYLCFYMKY